MEKGKKKRKGKRSKKEESHSFLACASKRKFPFPPMKEGRKEGRSMCFVNKHETENKFAF